MPIRLSFLWILGLDANMGAMVRFLACDLERARSVA